MSGYKHICPICKQYCFEYDLEYCPVCGWENDDFQEDFPDLKGANAFSLKEALCNYQATGRADGEADGNVNNQKNPDKAKQK